MDTLDDIKAVMEDLNHRRGVLAAQMKEFQQLQGEIQVLVEQSSHDSGPRQARKVKPSIP